MSKRIYVGNLPATVTEDEVRKLFREFGEVESVDLVASRETGRPRGFGFVELDDAAADQAIEELNLKDLGGRMLNVNEARPREAGRRSRW